MRPRSPPGCNDAGYFTGRIGKYLVGYNEPNRPPGSPDNSTYIPPGWDEWFSTYGGAPGYYNYGVNDNGQVIQFGNQPEDYSTDVLTNRVVSFMDQAEENDDQPFFALFAPSTPHAQGTAERSADSRAASRGNVRRRDCSTHAVFQ